MLPRSFRFLALFACLAVAQTSFAGGPRWVAGSSYFNSSAKGQPVHWKNGTVLYYTDPGALTPSAFHTLLTAVSGALFQGDAANPVNGPNYFQGNPANQYGSDDTSLEGSFDLSGVMLPIGTTIADYQLSLEAINPFYSAGLSVGPYTQGQVTPSGTMPVITLYGLTAGAAVTQDIVIQDSADESYVENDGSEVAPATFSASGEWTGRITGYGHAGWFECPVRPNRELTVEATALNETGAGSENKARLVLGARSGTDAAGTLPVSGTTQAFNGDQVGLTTLSVATVAPGSLRLDVADQRGDGRPDYLYRGRLLYADSVTPARLSLTVLRREDAQPRRRSLRRRCRQHPDRMGWSC